MRKKRIIVLLLVCTFVFGMFPKTAYADTGNLNGLEIITQPKNFFGEIGEAVTFSVGATGNGVKYQWQYKGKNATTWNNSNGTSAKTANWTLTVANVHYGFDFRCVLTDADGVTVYSDIIHINPLPGIIVQPKDCISEIGSSVTFAVEAKGEGLSYQWQYKEKSATAWNNSNSASAKTASWKLTVARVHYGFDFRCVVTDKNGKTEYSDIVHLYPELEITAQPEDCAGKIGSPVIFTIGAKGEGLSYQWQYKEKTSETWKNSSGASAKTASWTLTIARVHYGLDFRCVVTDLTGRSIISDEVCVIKEEELEIISQPENCIGDIGSAATFAVEAKGEGLSYQWQYKEKSATAWNNSNSASAKTASWKLTVARVHYGFDFRCVVTDKNGKTEYSDIVHLYPELEITAQPEECAGKIGSPVIFTIGAKGEGLSYQWQYKEKTSETWKNSSGVSAKTASWTLTIAQVHYGLDFRCVVTDLTGRSIISDEICVIKEEELEIISQPENCIGDIGSSVTFAVEAKGEGLSYQWQYKEKSATAWNNSNSASAKTASWKLTAARVHYGFDFRCVVTDKNGKTEYSDIVHLYPEMEITAQPEDCAGKIGSPVIFTIGAKGEGLSYQWQYKEKTSETWKNSSGASAKTASWTLTIAQVHYGLDFRCVVTDLTGRSIISDEICVIKEEELEIISQPENCIGDIGSSVTFAVEAKGEGLSYQWQYKEKSATAWNNSNSASAKTASWKLTVARVHYGFDFRCVVTDKNGETEYSDIVHIDPMLKIISQPQNYTGFIGDRATFEIEAKGENLTYQWQYKDKAAETWKNASGTSAKTASWILNIAQVHLGFEFRCVVKDNTGNTVITDSVFINLIEEPTIRVNSAEGDRGDEVEITIDLLNNPGITTAFLKLNYDEGITCTKIKTEKLFTELVVNADGSFDEKSSGMTFTPSGGYIEKESGIYVYESEDSTPAPNPCTLYWESSLANHAQSGKLVTLTFKIDENASLGSHGISISYNKGDIYDVSLENVDFEIIEGYVVVK